MDKQSFEEIYKQNKTIYKQKRLKLFVIPLCIIAARFIFQFARRFLPVGESFSTDALHHTYTIIGAVLSIASTICVLLIITFFFRQKRLCKKCMAWDAVQKVDEELINVQDVRVQETEYTEINKHNASGKYTGYDTAITSRSVPGKKWTFLQTYQCNCCGCLTYKQASSTRAV